MGSEKHRTGPGSLSFWLMGPAAGYFQKKLGIFQGRAKDVKPPQLQGDSPAEAERMRRRQGGARSTILSGVQGRSGGGNPVLGGS